jgi:large subunit ribosomal protein L19
MPTEKKGDDAREVEEKQASEQSTSEKQNAAVPDDSQKTESPDVEKVVEAGEKPAGESQAKAETAPEVKKEEKKKEEKEKEDKQEEGAVQPEKNEKRIGIGELDHYSEIRTDLPEIKSGDIIRVSYRVIEGGKERIQVFEGTVIALKHSGISRTITVRKTSFGISVERIFPLNSKLIQKIEVKKHSKVRRAKLYYLRKLKGKAARLKELR